MARAAGSAYRRSDEMGRRAGSYVGSELLMSSVAGGSAQYSKLSLPCDKLMVHGCLLEKQFPAWNFAGLVSETLASPSMLQLKGQRCIGLYLSRSCAVSPSPNIE